jgi:diamine N-acetyltransferase
VSVEGVPRVTLRPVTPENEAAVRALKVGPDQEQFVADNARSLEEGAAEEHAWIRAVYADDVPVGFVMMYIDADEGVYYVWRFMVGAAHQGCGYGRRAMELLIEHVRGQPNAAEILLSHRPGDGGPERFYKKLGYLHTGKVVDEELEMRLALD